MSNQGSVPLRNCGWPCRTSYSAVCSLPYLQRARILGCLFSIQCPQHALEQCMPRRYCLSTNSILYWAHFLLHKLFLFQPISKWSCKRVSHAIHFITLICAQTSLTTHIVLIMLNRHIIIFGFECYLILKDFLQDLTFTVHNKYPKSSQTFHISYFPCRETLILNCFIDGKSILFEILFLNKSINH